MLQFLPKSMKVPRRRALPGSQFIHAGMRISVSDTIAPAITERAGSSAEREVLANLIWEPATFTAEATADCDADLGIRFPSPKPQGIPDWDTAMLDWHFARDKSGQVQSAPAVIVLDILQGGNLVSGYIARTLAANGLHAFILHLPQNGRRMTPGKKHDWNYFLPSLLQGASDARRARDVVAALPMVKGGVSLQGTSLGGFIATMAASIDNGFASVILALTGGDVFGVLTKGKMDAARVRQRLREAGYTDDKLREWLWQIEPLRIAHRLEAKKTWLFSARHDQVVPKAHGQQLAQAIGLDWSHHRQLAGCHYTCAINARRFLQEMTRAIKTTTPPKRPPKKSLPG
jgi:hypothetical protein